MAHHKWVLRSIAILLCYGAIIPGVRINKNASRSEFLCAFDLRAEESGG
jgi:hypothetical protein